MPIKVDFELLKDTIGLLHNGSLPTEEHFDNLLLFFDKLAESSTFAHLAHKQLSKSQKPFDKLKELWEGYKKTDCSCLEEYLVGKGRAYNSNTIHQWIAEHCGFLTTAEVRQAIQELKSSELIHKSSDDMRNEDY